MLRIILALASVLMGFAAAQEPPAIGYRTQVAPILEKRCVVCHACFDAPCQLKLGVPEGLQRGASKDKVYEGTRIQEATPSRLFVDATHTEQWRQRGFTPVLADTATRTPGASSVLARMLALKTRHPQPNTGTLGRAFEFGLDRKQSCPAPHEMDAFERDHPQWGMPYGFPALPNDEMQVLQRWLDQGAPLDTALPPLPSAIQHQVSQWETFLNGTSPKERLVARYLYEHLFQAHLHFQAGAGQPYFRLVRARTPPGQAVVPLATRRPTDDPGAAPFYYRLERERESLVDKNHMPFALGPQRLAHWRRLLLEAPYTVQHLPGYSDDVASNPFVVFQDIPAATRYRFLLDEAEFFVMGFIKGPVCRGQVALNVIEDHFWVFFYNDRLDADGEGLDELLRQQAHNLALPAEQSSQAGFLSPWMGYALRERAYLQAKTAYMAQKVKEGRRIDLNLIWDGEGHNPNAALTVFRHFDNATVVKGLLGEPPKTAWVLSYSLLERIHYLLVAGFDVYGNIGHQLLSRLYMDFLRMEGEFNFLALLPHAERERIQAYWYRGATPQAQLFLRAAQAEATPETHIPLRSGEPQRELYGLLKSHLAPVLDTRHDLASLSDHPLARDLRNLAALRGAPLSQLPELSVLRIDQTGQAPRYFTLLRNTGHRNVSQLLTETSALAPAENTLTVAVGLVGSYPNALYRVDRERLGTFTQQLSQLRTALDYRAFAERYAIRRTHPQFWAFSDALQQAHQAQDAVRDAGLLDYNRWENR